MLKYHDSLIRNHRPKGLLLDTSAISVWLTFQVDRSNLQSVWGRELTFTEDHGVDLDDLIRHFLPGKLWAIPHVFVEATKWAKKMDHRYQKVLYDLFGDVKEDFDLSSEINEKLFYQFGLTDTALLRSMRKNKLGLLTSDTKLAVQAHAEHPTAVFNLLQIVEN